VIEKSKQLKYADDRYRNDQLFAQLVDIIYKSCKLGKFTPSEVREAATLAQIKFEMDNPRPVMLSPQLRRELGIE
jgi:hypothetical protein